MNRPDLSVVLPTDRIETPLPGGRTNPVVVRVADTVRRSQSERSPFVHHLLQGLQATGFEGAPRFLGIDEHDREMLTFLPGEVPHDLGSFSGAPLRAAARLLRALHDATASSDLADLRGDQEVICHGDPSPCNAVFRRGAPYAWIDFDDAHPGTRGEDLGYAAWLWLDIGADDWRPEQQATRLARFFGDYGASPGIDRVQVVLDAQRRRRPRDAAHAAWTAQCRRWTEQHRQVLRLDPGPPDAPGAPP